LSLSLLVLSTARGYAEDFDPAKPYGITQRVSASQLQRFTQSFMEAINDDIQFTAVAGAKGGGSRYLLDATGRRYFGRHDPFHLGGPAPWDKYTHSHIALERIGYNGDAPSGHKQLTIWLKPCPKGGPGHLQAELSGGGSLTSEQIIKLRLAYQEHFSAAAPDFRPSWDGCDKRGLHKLLPQTSIVRSLRCYSPAGMVSEQLFRTNPEIEEYIESVVSRIDERAAVDIGYGLQKPSEMIFEADRWSREALPLTRSWSDYFSEMAAGANELFIQRPLNVLNYGNPYGNPCDGI
jgi:hypothetical protein